MKIKFNNFSVIFQLSYISYSYFISNKIKTCGLSVGKCCYAVSYLYYHLYNKITMYKEDPKFRRFANLEGHLEKLSSNFLLGFQPRFWKVLDNGTKVGYSNQPQQPIKAQNIFLIKDCFASESSGNTIFQLQAKDKIFTLKAPNQEERTDWIKGLTFLKKVINNQVKLKTYASPITETTMATKSQRLKPKKMAKIETTTSLNIQKPRVYQPQDLIADKNIEVDVIQQLKKFLPEKCLKYYTLLTSLKVKTQGLFVDSFSSSTYLLISPKSLYPQIYIGDENLTNLSLPPWLEVNYFYKILNLNAKEKSKQVFNVNKIVDINNGPDPCSLKINIGEFIHQFLAETVQQKQCLKTCLEIATLNSQEVVVNGKISKRNFDKLINLHSTNKNQFQNESKKIIASLLKDPNIHKYQPPSLFEFIEGSMIFLKEFILILGHKKNNSDDVILDMLKYFHEEIKMQAKLTWDSSFFQIKGTQILNMLKKLSEYYEMMKNYIKSSQFLQGMKQLSKIYVRMSWINFESIILNIVEQQKKNNIFQDDELQYIQTNGITDLFKFIYNVFDLAYPHWKNKIHLHNVNRLMQRALQVFVNQIRSMIDEQVIPDKQMIGLANNYFCFQDYVKEFYTSKFQELAEKTQEYYDKIINSYREVSMIILEKLAINIGQKLEQYCQKCTIQTIKCDTIEQILVKSVTPLQKLVHMAFQKKMHEKIANQVHIKICNLVVQQVGLKKKLKLKEIIRCIKQLRTGLNSVFDELCRSHTSIQRKMEELQRILSYDLYSDIQAIIISCAEPSKGLYLKIMQLREDFSQGSALYRIVNQQNLSSTQNPEIKRAVTKRRMSIDPINRQKNATLSKIYFQQQIMDSDQNDGSDRGVSQGKTNKVGSSNETNNKLISEGFLTKGKRNHKVWEKEYFRLKNGFLYIFHSQESERCSNAIQIKKISKIQVHNKEKPSFLLTYNNLGKQKQIKLKADSIEIRERWVNSLQLEKKRMLNEQQVKKKAIKYRQTQALGGKKKNQMIIDYEELEKGKDYFSYS